MCPRTSFDRLSRGRLRIRSGYHVLDRSFQVMATTLLEADPNTTSTNIKPHLDPSLVATRSGEKKLMKQGILPIGSRRRRLALRTSANIPFEHMPYQCFQEAMDILRRDRQEKLNAIERQRARIARLRAKTASSPAEAKRDRAQILSIGGHLERLKILADINDPLIKKRFEDGQGTI